MSKHCPHGANIFVGQCHRGDIRVAPVEQIGQPTTSVVGLVLRREDRRARSVDQQCAQIRITAFTHPQERGLATAGALARYQTQLGGRLAGRCQSCAHRRSRPTARWPPTEPIPGICSGLRLSSLPRRQAIIRLLSLLHLPVEFFEMLGQAIDQVPERHGQFVARILEQFWNALDHVADATRSHTGR